MGNTKNACKYFKIKYKILLFYVHIYQKDQKNSLKNH